MFSCSSRHPSCLYKAKESVLSNPLFSRWSRFRVNWPEIILRKLRKEHCITVHWHEVLKVLFILSWIRVHCTITSWKDKCDMFWKNLGEEEMESRWQLTSKCIHECWQGPIQHLEEWIPARIHLRSAQNRVLQDVRNTSIIHRYCLECDTRWWEADKDLEGYHRYVVTQSLQCLVDKQTCMRTLKTYITKELKNNIIVNQFYRFSSV